MDRKKTKRLTLAAILSAIGCVLILLGGIFETLDLSVAALSSFCVVVATVELRGKYPYLVYAVTAALSLIIMPSSAAIYYALFLGYYPIVKYHVEKLNKIFAYIVKFSLFNTFLIVMYFFFNKLLGIDFGQKWMAIALIVLFNLFFFLYDFVLSRIILVYIVKIRKLLRLEDIFDKKA